MAYTIHLSQLNNYSDYYVYTNTNHVSICNCGSISTSCSNFIGIDFLTLRIQAEFNQINIDEWDILIGANASNVKYSISNFGENVEHESLSIKYRINDSNEYVDGLLVKINSDQVDGLIVDIKNNDAITFFNLSTVSKQDAKIVNSTPVTHPVYTNKSRIKLIDSSLNNSNVEYTYYSELNINGSKRYFGVKRKPYIKKYGITETEGRIISEKPNINSEIVLLNPNTTQTQIYSFKNGMQYMEINNDTLKKQRPLPHYTHSYEYMIEGILPESSKRNDPNEINIKFYGAYAYSSSSINASTFPGINNIIATYYGEENQSEEYISNVFETYSFIATYNYSISEYNSFNVIHKSANLEKNLPNAYEVTYSKIENNVDVYRSYFKYVDIFVKNNSYIKIGKNFTFEELIEKGSNQELSDIEKYWIYDNYKKSYIIADNSSLAIYSSIPDIYVKCVSYMKVSSDAFEHDTKYVQDYEYSQYLEKEDVYNGEILYLKVNTGPDIYLPIKPGVIEDGTIEYYAYTYVNLKDIGEAEKASILNEISEGTRNVFIKQEYKPIDAEEFLKYDVESLYTSNNNVSTLNNSYTANVALELTKTTDYMENLDITGNTIYANNSQYVYSLSEIKGKYFNTDSGRRDANSENTGEEWYAKNINKERVTGNIVSMALSSFDIDYTVNYDGTWKNISFESQSDSWTTVVSHNPNGIFIKENSFNTINPTLCDFESNADYYVYKIGKININEINFDNKTIYIDSSRFNLETNDNDIISIPTVSSLAKINKFGFIVNPDVIYYERHNKYVKSNDLYRFANKDYYSYLNSITKSGTTELLPLSLLRLGDPSENAIHSNFTQQKISNNLVNFFINNDAASYLVDENGDTLDPSVEYSSYYINVSAFIPPITQQQVAYAYVDIGPYKGIQFNIADIRYYTSKVTHYILGDELSSFEDLKTHNYDKLFMHSKYFYPDMTINNGIHYGKDGSYYTNIIIYDGTRGSISKSLTLQPNIFNVTNYTYDYVTYSYVDALNYDLASINENHYSDFYLGYYVNDEFTQFRLSPESYSPDYWASYITYLGETSAYSLSIKRRIEKTGVFDGRTVENDDYNLVQYFNNDTYAPYPILKYENLFGILFHDKIINESDTDEYDNVIINPTTKLINTPFTGVTSMEYAYEYDVVELKEVIYEDTTIEDPLKIYQPMSVSSVNDITPIPFYISNEKHTDFVGTYSWNNPKHTYVFVDDNGSYSPIDIVKTSGYWSKDTVESTIPFKIASYNFYVNKDEVSSTTATYMYIPMSYVISSTITHPSISYDYIINEVVETNRFTYIYNGKEYNYFSTEVVQENEDGTYIGKANIDGEDILVNLIRHTELDKTSKVSKILHQNNYISYEYFSYKNAIALTNEKLPLLYNIELIPASTHKVQYWNEDAESYAIKTVVDSYAHYVYNYIYDTVPFVVSAYLNAGENFNIANLVDVSNSINNVNTTLNLLKDSSYEFNSSFGNTISGSVDTISSSINSSISDLSTVLTAKADDLTNAIQSIVTSEADNKVIVSYLNESHENSFIISYAINDLYDSLSSELRNIRNSLANDITNMSDSISYLSNNYYTYWLEVSYNSNGGVTYIDKHDRQLNKKSVVETLDNTFNIRDINVKTTYNDDGTWTKTYESEIRSIAYLIKNLTVSTRVPTYEQFMIDLVPKLYAKCDFEKEIIDTEHKDENGNVISTGKHKPNPIDLAKKSIYRADILWNEMHKKGII